MGWIDMLVPATPADDPVLDRVQSVVLRDGQERLELCPLDTATVALIREAMYRPGLDLLVQLPRGRHDVAITCALAAQLILLGATATGEPAPFTGPVVTIGMNSNVQERLSRIRIQNIPLDQGLSVHRIRGDGRIAGPTGEPIAYRLGTHRLLYLNTRVGWPNLPRRVPGLVVIDRTTFSDRDVLRNALAWAARHEAHTVVVVSDIGDETTCEALDATGRNYVTWPWVPPLTEHVAYELGDTGTLSPLSMAALLQRPERSFRRRIAFSAQAADELFRSALKTITQLRVPATELPRPLIAARRLLNGLARCVSSISTYNQWAALDPRASALSTLELEVGSYRSNAFTGAWRVFGEARWEDLRYTLLELYRMIADSNPKLYALAYGLDRVRADHPDARIVVRTVSMVAAEALTDDLTELGEEYAPDGTRLRCLPWSHKMPWVTTETVEVHPAAPPPWHRSVLSSAESVGQYHVLYPYEAHLVGSDLARGAVATEQRLAATFRAFMFLDPPSITVTASIPVAYGLEVDERPAEPRFSEQDLSLDESLLLTDIADDVGTPAAVESDDGGPAVRARPIVLEPDGSIWWVRHNATVEAIVTRRYHHVPVPDLRAGDVVIVPRGEGREDLFTRIVQASHSRTDMQAFEVMFERWRNACWMVYEQASSNWREVERLMAGQGSRVGWQAQKAWAYGNTIAPDDPEDIARIGRLSKDEFVLKQHKRLSKMATAVRALHVQLGRLLSKAMSEAMTGSGPNLRALQNLVDDLDVTELLDEYERRAVRAVGGAEDVPAGRIGKVVVGT